MIKLKKAWVLYFLLFISIWGVLILTFWPGFYSPDSIGQYAQAKNNVYDSWHPAPYASIWRILIVVTGLRSSMLILQVSLFVAVAGVLFASIKKQTKNTHMALLSALVYLISPFTLSIVGVMWKDVLLAQLLSITSVMLFAQKAYKIKGRTRLNVAIVISSLACMIIAASLRHGVALMVIPLGYLLFERIFNKKIFAFAASIAVLVMSLAYLSITNIIFNVKERHTEIAVMVDDIKELASVNEIAESNISTSSKQYLHELKESCGAKGVKLNSLFVCGVSTSKFVDMEMNDTKEVTRLWEKTILSHKVNYIKFRLKSYTTILDTGNSAYVLPQPTTVDNNEGVGISSSILTRAYLKYNKISMRDYFFGYKAYFWLIISVCGMLVTFYYRKRLTMSGLVLAIYASGVIYILQYMPVTIAGDYRYVYWTVCSSVIASLILIANLMSMKNGRMRKI